MYFNYGQINYFYFSIVIITAQHVDGFIHYMSVHVCDVYAFQLFPMWTSILYAYHGQVIYIYIYICYSCKSLPSVMTMREEHQIR